MPAAELGCVRREFVDVVVCRFGRASDTASTVDALYAEAESDVAYRGVAAVAAASRGLRLRAVQLQRHGPALRGERLRHAGRLYTCRRLVQPGAMGPIPGHGRRAGLAVLGQLDRDRGRVPVVGVMPALLPYGGLVLPALVLAGSGSSAASAKLDLADLFWPVMTRQAGPGCSVSVIFGPMPRNPSTVIAFRYARLGPAAGAATSAPAIGIAPTISLATGSGTLSALSASVKICGRFPHTLPCCQTLLRRDERGFYPKHARASDAGTLIPYQRDLR